MKINRFFLQLGRGVVRLTVGCSALLIAGNICLAAVPGEPVIGEHVQVRGLIISDLRTTLSAQVPGSIDEICVDMGQSFKAGQVLVRLNEDIYRAQYNRVQAELQGAQQQFEANRKLRELKSIGALEVLQSEALVQQKQSGLKIYQIQWQQCTVKAPFSGRVVERLANPHQYVTQGTPLLEIIDDQHLSLQAFVPSNWVASIRIGQKFAVFVDEIAMHFAAQVTALGAQIDTNSQMLEIRAAIEGQHPELLAGMSGRIEFTDLLGVSTSAHE
jgi:RND family efflux transporter MFP subunit